MSITNSERHLVAVFGGAVAGSEMVHQLTAQGIRCVVFDQNILPHGKIEDAELEREHGKLVYSFDIRNPKGTITEVQIDAKTGKIVSVEEENAAAEVKEKAEDAKPKKKN